MFSLLRHLGIGIPAPGEDLEFDELARASFQEGGSSGKFLRDCGRRKGIKNVTAACQADGFGMAGLTLRLDYIVYDREYQKAPTRHFSVGDVTVRFTPAPDSVFQTVPAAHSPGVMAPPERWRHDRTSLLAWLDWLPRLQSTVSWVARRVIRRLIFAAKQGLRAASLAVLALLANVLDALEVVEIDRLDCVPSPKVIAPGGASCLFITRC